MEATIVSAAGVRHFPTVSADENTGRKSGCSRTGSQLCAMTQEETGGEARPCPQRVREGRGHQQRAATSSQPGVAEDAQDAERRMRVWGGAGSALPSAAAQTLKGALCVSVREAGSG